MKRPSLVALWIQDREDRAGSELFCSMEVTFVDDVSSGDVGGRSPKL
jgi:hypothetical protein